MLKSFKPLHWGIIGISAILLLTTAIVFFGKTDTASTYEQKKVDPAFSEYVSAYTSGIISRSATVTIRFSQQAISHELVGTTASDELFSISPSVKGKLTWVDQYTLAFQPQEWLDSDKVYDVAVRLDLLFKDISKDLKKLEFNFKTIRQDFEVKYERTIVSAKNMKVVQLVGRVVVADVCKLEDIQKIISVKQSGAQPTVTWTAVSANEFEFLVDNVARKETVSEVEINWDGDAIGVSKKGNEKVEIRAMGDFSVIDVQVIQSQEQYVLLSFSDPLDEKQNLQGLIELGNNTALRFIIKNNEVEIYPATKQLGTVEIKVNKGILNVLGYKMPESFSAQLVFEQIKPAVRGIGTGVIVPNSNGLIFSFEAVSLKAVDMRILQIFENNVSQFLQNNNVDGNRDMKRVGRPIFKKVITLDQNKLKNLNKWNRFSIDLADYINPQAGAIYQVEVSFRQSQSVYACAGQAAVEDNMTSLEDEDWSADSYSEYSYWDDYEDYYYYEDYDWNERENPCHSSYYRQNNRFTKNIYASNLGIIAKYGKNSEMLVAITDILTTKQLENVSIEVLDFQQQVCGKGTTNADGLCILKLSNQPFLVVAKLANDVGYLKTDNANALSLSNFNVGGNEVKKGIKGFIYGERGVWRPGDTLFLSFILEDKNKTLPSNHPVIFELINPEGKLEKREVQTKGVNGFYTFKPVTDESAPTGNWSCKVKVGGTSFSRVVKIETIKPNRLKINLDFGKESLSVSDASLKGALEVSWLHGGIAKNMHTTIEVVLTKGTTRFEAYKDYVFEDQSRYFTAETQLLFEGKTDENGKASIPATINTEGDAPGVLNAHFRGKVFEEGGDFSISQFTIPYYPYASFVGLRMPEGDQRGMLMTDKEHLIDIINLNPSGKLTSNAQVEVEVYKLDWRWWWDQSAGAFSNYVNSEYHQPISSSFVNLVNGKGQYKLNIKYPEWGRYYIRVKNHDTGHASGQVFYIDWPNWAGKAKRDMPDAATMLTFSTDKNSYKVGENMQVSIPGSDGGNALITLENGTKVVDTYWLSLQKGENKITIPIKEGMAPNVFVHVTALQPHAQTVNDLPIRLYGVIPINIDDPATHLTPLIEMANALSPGKEVNIKVREQDGKTMTYTIAVVDEGLLSLTNFKTPNPWTSFYEREAIGVNTWDIYKYIIGAYGGEVERILAIGGDAAIVQEDGEKDKRFKPVVRYFGPYHLEAGTSKTTKFIMPNYVGAVRTMVVAGYNGAYGSVEKETPVRQSLMVLGSLPRVLGPAEKVKLPVTVFAYDKGVQEATITVKTKGPVKLALASKKVSFTKPGDKVIDFDLEVLAKVGFANIEIEAVSGTHKATYDIAVEIRNPNPYISKIVEKVLKPGESVSHTIQLLGMYGTNSTAVELSATPSLGLQNRLDYLIRYPHGCIEQTTSSVFPQLFLPQLVELSIDQKEKLEINIKKGIERLKSMQISSGGFAYWPGSTHADEWGSTYAGHFMVEANKRGYYVSSSTLSDWKQYQRDMANKWTKTGQWNNELIQAYRLYTLAIADNAQLGAMNRLREEALSPTASYLLAAAYAKVGQTEAAKNLIAGKSFELKEYRELGYTYGSTFRDRALLLLALTELNDVASAMLQLNTIAKIMKSNHWLSTQETAFALIATSNFLGKNGGEGNLTFSVTVDGEKENTISQLPAYQRTINSDKLTSKAITVTNTGKAPVYVLIADEGQPLLDNQEEASEVISLVVNYMDKSGNTINPEQIKQNEEFLMEVIVSNDGTRGKLEQLALSAIFPSGWEVQNARMDAIAAHFQGDVPEYQDYRDDRVYTYFDMKAGGSKKFTFLISASYAGTYQLPGVSCEAMYDKSIFAYRKGRKSEVVK